MVWHRMVWCGMAWCGMAWHGMANVSVFVFVTDRCLVRAINIVGLTSSIVASDGFSWDPTTPTNGTVVDGIDPDVDIAVTANAFNITASWVLFRDPDSTIVAYEVGVGSCDSWEDVTLIDVGLATTHAFSSVGGGCSWPSGLSTYSGCELPHGSTYCVVVRALNAHGLWGARKHSNGQTVPHIAQLPKRLDHL